MDESKREWAATYRIAVIAVIVTVTVVITSVSVVLANEAQWRADPGSILRWLLVGALALLSGIIGGNLANIVHAVWKQPDKVNDIGVIELAGRLGRTLRRPTKLITVGIVTVGVVGAGVVLRSPTDLEPGPLRIMTAFGESPSDPRSILLKQWNQQHPNNRAEFDYAPGETDEQHDRMTNDAEPGGAHEADIYALDLVWMAEFADRGYVRELDATKLPDMGDFISKVIDTCRRNGKLWALPFNTDAGLIFYRTDIRGVGRPDSWDDFFGTKAAQVARSAKSTRPGLEAANAAQLGDAEVLTVAALEAIWAAGGGVITQDGKVSQDPDRSVAFGSSDRTGITKLATASHDSDLVLTGEDGARMTQETEAVQQFASGRTLFMRNWPVALDQLDQVRPKVPFAVTSPPTPSVLGGQNLAISTRTDKPRAAQALIEFLTSPSSELILSEIGGFAPVRNSAFENAKRPYSQELRKAVDDAGLRPTTPCYTRFSQVFRKGIIRALNNDGKLEQSFPRELAESLACP
jgi:multiple sugar transport system substrate-binding protein